MEQTQLTPPAAIEVDHFDRWQCPGGSASTNTSFFHQDWSPESVMTVGTSATTPPSSPPMTREMGPTLLPRVRAQDQIGSLAPQSCYGHGRTTSLPSNPVSAQFGSYLPIRQPTDRRSVSPAAALQAASPAPTANDSVISMEMTSHRPSISNLRSQSFSGVNNHRRVSSTTSISQEKLRQYGFPYRHGPALPSAPARAVSMSRTSSAMSHLAPMCNDFMQSYPARKRTVSPPANPSRLSCELEMDQDWQGPVSSILDYLTAPNPAPLPTLRVPEVNLKHNEFMWFDVHNVRDWAEFNIVTLLSMPMVLTLLKIEQSLKRFPTPVNPNLRPESRAQLADLCMSHYAYKVNAALRATLGDHMTVAIRTLNSASASHKQADFVANYQSATDNTIYGDGHGRVIGIVKCHDMWNSGFRTGNNVEKVKYLHGLAHLHHLMREHSCRYGYIITEFELVCVRAGGPPETQSKGALFGYVELADSIPLEISGRDQETGQIQMTAGLALWYLHMLARDQTWPGQLPWKMHVGAPGGLTRQNVHGTRDELPKPSAMEMRHTRHMRGWVWPKEPLSKKEMPKRSQRGRRVKT